MEEITSLEIMIAGLTIFMVFHLSTGIYEVRQRLISVLELGGYRVMHSLFALIGLGLVVIGFAGREMVPVYEPLPGARWTTIILMYIAVIFMVGAYAPGKLRFVTRHPMLIGIIIWSVAHLISNGDKASIILFSGFGIYAVLAILFIERKARLGNPEGYAVAKATTSITPFKALFAGKVPKEKRGDWGIRALVWGTLIFGLLILAHPYVIGVPALLQAY